MFILSCLEQFSRDTKAAVTVDWVVLTAALVTISIGVALTIGGALDASTSSLSTNLNTVVSDVLP